MPKRLSLKIALTTPKYQCCYCGRTFIEKVTHKCKGNFRKRHLKFIDYVSL